MRFLPLIFLLLLACQSSLANPSPYKAVYRADYKGLPVRAEGIRELREMDDGSFLLVSEATSFLASVTEISRFKLQPNNRFVPLKYQYHRKGVGRNRDAVLMFNWPDSRVVNDVKDKPWQMDIPNGTLDKLLYQLQMRQDLAHAWNAGAKWPALRYQVADGGRLKQYNFEVLGKEVVATPVGKIDTIKARRLRGKKDRTTIFWMAPEWEFLLIRFQQTNEKGRGFELLLKEAEFAGKPVRGH